MNDPTLDRYLNGDYADKNPDWDSADAPWQASKITKVLSDSSQNFFLNYGGICTVTEQALATDGAAFARVKDFIQHPPVIARSDIDELISRHGLKAIAESYLRLIQEKNHLGQVAVS